MGHFSCTVRTVKKDFDSIYYLYICCCFVFLGSLSFQFFQPFPLSLQPFLHPFPPFFTTIFLIFPFFFNFFPIPFPYFIFPISFFQPPSPFPLPNSEHVSLIHIQSAKGFFCIGCNLKTS